MSDLVGQKLGPYEITALIGRGGMATVYLAQQPSVGRTVAVKVLPPQLLHDQTFLIRFRREVQAVARLQHPRIIPVYDYGEDRDIPYIVMAYIEGGSLAERIKDVGGLSLDETQRLISQIAEGLDYAHHMGVIHRDFKPSNVLLDAGGNAYLSDFGIAKVSQETMQLTGSGIVGTPTYMAPEMFKQEEATPSVDIYALGVTLYQMLSGDAPFSGTTPVQLMYAHLNEPIPAIETVRPDVPPQVQAVLDRAMAKNPAARYPSAGALAQELALAARGELQMVDGNTQPLDLPKVAVTAAPIPTGEIEAALPPTPVVPPRPGGQPPLAGGVAQMVEMANQIEAMDRKHEEEKRRAKEERERAKQERRKDWQNGPRQRGRFPWLLVLIIGVAIFLGVCKGASLIGGAVGAAFSNGAGGQTSDGTPAAGTIGYPLNGATSLEVNITLGTGKVTIDGSGDSDVAAEGDYAGHGNLQVDQAYQVTGGKGVLEITQKSGDPDKKGMLDTFTLSLPEAIPTDLTVNAGAGETTLDLENMLLTALRVKGGIGKYNITLPSTGSYNVDITAGVGETDLYIPEDVEARVDVTGGLSNIDVADSRFKDKGNNIWETAGYQAATKRVRISITAGVGQVVIDRP